MRSDAELDTWRRQWQSQTLVPLDLQQRVRQQIRAARLGLAASVVITIVFGIGMPVWAIASRRVDVAVLAIGVWLFLVTTWVASLTMAKGTWKPASQTTAAFLDFSILSCRRNRQSIAVAAVLYVALLAFVMTWKYHELSSRAPLDPWTYLTSQFNLVVWLVTVGLAALGAWRRWKLAQELHNLMELKEPSR